MAPPSAIHDEQASADTPNGHPKSTQAPLEPGLSEDKSRGQAMRFPAPPKFDDKYKEREYQKGYVVLPQRCMHRLVLIYLTYSRLAAAFRIFGRYGFDEGVAGHITLRDPVDPDTFWVNPFGVAFSLIKASDLIQVDHHGTVIAGGETRLLNTAAFMIHSAIHHARPDVMAAAHSHSIYGRSFCALGKKLDTITQDSCAFHNDHVVYESFNGVVLAEKEGKNIAACLGQTKAALLQNHGLLTVGQTVEEAVFWFLSMEKCCHAQLLADAAGTTKKIDEDDAVFTYKTVGTPRAGWFSAKPIFDVVHKETGGDYLG